MKILSRSIKYCYLETGKLKKVILKFMKDPQFGNWELKLEIGK
jgi:hypothetical protein